MYSSILFKTHAVEPHEQVKPQFYAFRWITLLLTQEFKFESILRIWDTLLSNTFGVQVSLSWMPRQFLRMKSKFISTIFLLKLNSYGYLYRFLQDMLLRFCCAMLLCMKSRLLSGDFVANIKLLQHYPDDVNLEYLLQVAQDISPDTSSYIMSLWFMTMDIFQMI